MPKSIQEKREMVHQLQEKYDQAKSVLFVSFEGLTVKENESLRKELEGEGGEYLVTKKTLLDKALKDKQVEGYDTAKNMEGKIAIVFSFQDEVAAAKVVDKHQQGDNGKIQFVGGVLNNRFLKGGEVADLAKIPGKQELYAKLVGSMNAPVSGFVNVLGGNLRSLMHALKAIEEKKS